MTIFKNKIISYRVAFIAWILGVIALTVLSLLPPGEEPSFAGLVNDKIRHFTAYAILALMACHAGRNWQTRLILCGISFMVSVSIEFLQPLTGRHFELLDIVANLSGIIAGLAVMAHLLRRRGARESAAEA